MLRYALFAGLLALTPTLAFATNPNPTPTMNVGATGTVKAKPDQGYITLGVTTQAKKSADAVKENAATMRTLFTTLKGKGLKEEEIQTTDFSVSENYKYVSEVDPEDATRRVQKQVKNGYIVHNSVQLTICNLEKFGEILDAVTADGANQIYNISFGSSKSKDSTDEARKQAIAEAKKKSKDMADALGVTLGRVLTVTENTHQVQPRRMYDSLRGVQAAGAPSADVPISGGSLSFSVSVTVEWEILGSNTPGKTEGPPQLFKPLDK